VKVVGWVYELDASRLLIGDRMLYIDSASGGVDEVQIGDFVSATARVDDDGRLLVLTLRVQSAPGLPASDTWTARPLPNQPPDQPLGYLTEFRGVIEEMDPRYWMVDGQMVLVNARTIIKGQPEAGALAEVKGRVLFSESVLAYHIRVVVPGALEEVEFEGTIESLTEDVWVVGGTVVRIGPLTVVDGTPGVGAMAQVRGVQQPDNSVLAQGIVIQYPGIPGMTVLEQVEGLVESIGDTEWAIAGTRIVLESSSLVDDSRAPAEVGMWAVAVGYSQPDGSLLAVRIRLSRPD
jgi:hypothetical protein